VTWDPAIPATDADLLSAPVRGNFQALDAMLVAPVTAAAVDTVLKVSAGDVVAAIPTGTNGHVLTLVAGAPSWSALPTTMTLTGLTLSGMTAGSVLFAGASGVVSQDNASLFFDDTTNSLRLGAGSVGTSGQYVLALGPGTEPTTSPADTVQLTTVDLNAAAGSRALHIRDERGGTFQFGTDAAGFGGMYVRTPGGPVVVYLLNYLTAAGFGTQSNHALTFWTNDVTRMTLRTDHNIELSVANVAPRLLGTGAADSGGAGWRTLLIAN
jgi:hypothetical protein